MPNAPTLSGFALVVDPDLRYVFHERHDQLDIPDCVDLQRSVFLAMPSIWKTHDIDPRPFSGIVASIAALNEDEQCDENYRKDATADNPSNRSTDMLKPSYFEAPEAWKELAVCQDCEKYSVECESQVVELDCRLWRRQMSRCILFAYHGRVEEGRG